MTSCQVPPPLVSFLANVALRQGGPGVNFPQNPREERECAGPAGRVPGQVVTQFGSVPKGLQGGSKFTEKEYYSLLSLVLSCLKC